MNNKKERYSGTVTMTVTVLASCYKEFEEIIQSNFGQFNPICSDIQNTTPIDVEFTETEITKDETHMEENSHE